MNWNITETPTEVLTIRDKFAIQILNGLLSHQRNVHYLTLVRESYEIADMMLQERNKQTTNKD